VAGKLTAFHAVLLKWLEADARRPKRDRRTAKALHAELKAQGFEGGYTILTDFIRDWRQRTGANAPTRAFVPLKFELGEAFQFDWSEERLVVGGVWRKLMVAHLKLCASRAFVLVAYPSQGHEMLFDAHTKSFQALGGIARRGIYDNMKTAVDKVKKGKGRVVNARFFALCSHYLFDPDFCNVASGWGEAGFRNACVALPQPARCANRAVGRGAGVSSRRTCRTAGGGFGRRPDPSALAR
jgi:transposase